MKGQAVPLSCDASIDVYHGPLRAPRRSDSLAAGRFGPRGLVCVYHMAVDQNPVLSRGPPPPLLQAFVAPSCYKFFVVDFSRL